MYSLVLIPITLWKLCGGSGDDAEVRCQPVKALWLRSLPYQRPNSALRLLSLLRLLPRQPWLPILPPSLPSCARLPSDPTRWSRPGPARPTRRAAAAS